MSRARRWSENSRRLCWRVSRYDGALRLNQLLGSDLCLFLAIFMSFKKSSNSAASTLVTLVDFWLNKFACEIMD